eukprot:3663692-Heterocapsa_arctica.AAC.1
MESGTLDTTATTSSCSRHNRSMCNPAPISAWLPTVRPQGLALADPAWTGQPRCNARIDLRCPGAPAQSFPS